MSNIPAFLDREIEDDSVRQNFRKLREFLVSETPFLGFRFFEVEFDAASTDFDFKHNLGFQPKDAVLTFVSNGASVQFDYDSFTKEFVRLTVSAGCVVRFLIGSFDSRKR